MAGKAGNESEPSVRLRNSGIALLLSPLSLAFLLSYLLLEGMETIRRLFPVVIGLATGVIVMVGFGLSLVFAAPAVRRREFALARNKVSRAATSMRLVAWTGLAAALVTGFVQFALDGGWWVPAMTGVSVIMLGAYVPSISRAAAKANELLEAAPD